MDTISHSQKSIVALYDTHKQAENEVIQLQDKGFDMKQFSIIAVDLYTSEQALRYYNTADLMKRWATSGAFYVGFWGFLFGFSTYQIPIIGPSLMQGWVGAFIFGIFMAALGAIVSALGAGIYCLIARPAKKIKYQTEVKAGKYMLLVQGEAEQLDKLREILHLHVPKETYNVKNWREQRLNSEAT